MSEELTVVPRQLILSVNIDHVATLRQARQSPYPDPVEAAAIAEDAGAAGITVHLRSDRRHIQDHDVERLRPKVAGKLNLEIAPTEEMLAIATRLRPHQVSLVPERPEEVTTEGGLDVIRQGELLTRASDRLREAGIEVSIFLDPDLAQIDAVDRLGRERVHGFEINTDAYTKACIEGSSEQMAEELDKVRNAALDGNARGLAVYAGHGLTTANVVEIAAIEPIEELNIGHWLVSRASLVGMATSVQEMLAAMHQGRTRLG